MNLKPIVAVLSTSEIFGEEGRVTTNEGCVSYSGLLQTNWTLTEKSWEDCVTLVIEGCGAMVLARPKETLTDKRREQLVGGAFIVMTFTVFGT